MAAEHREALVPKHDRQQKEQQPSYRKPSDRPILGHGETLRILVEKHKDEKDPRKRAAPSAVRERTMRFGALRFT